MKLQKFDGRPVRVTTKDGEVFEGVCTYHNAEFNEHEYGCAKEGLSFPYLLLYKSEIKQVEVLKNGFSSPFGKLEELALADGMTGVEEVLFCEERDHVLRLLRCLAHTAQTERAQALPPREELLCALRELAQTTADAAVRAEALRLAAFWETKNEE